MHLAALIKWIDAHLTTGSVVDNGDGTITISTSMTDRDGTVYFEWNVIPATLEAARDLLGY